MLKCELMRNNKCTCSNKCVKWIYYYKAISDVKEKLDRLSLDRDVYERIVKEIGAENG